MWPWGHLAVGYLAYALLRRRSGGYPTEMGTVALAIGTQTPDLVDKPLAWWFALLPNGRSLAHSVLIAGLLWVVVLAVARRLGQWEVGTAFVVGYAFHLAGDALQPALAGNVADLAFLAWPVLPPVVYDGPGSFVGHFLGMELTPFLLFEFALVAVAFAAWVRDGLPGTARLRAQLG